MSGCGGTVVANLVKERTGNITIRFINDSDYRAAFSYGTWDEWDRSPGPINFEQTIVGPRVTLAPVTLPCARNFAIGTQKLVDRVLLTDADDTDDFNPDAFDVVVHFSHGTSDTDVEAVPTRGTALGIEKLLGVDYSCQDQLVVTFVEDPDAEGGFRIDFEVLLDERDEP